MAVTRQDAGTQRAFVLAEAHHILVESDARLTRLVEQLDPALPDASTDFSYIQGLVHAATRVAERLARQAEVAVQVDDLEVREPGQSLSPAHPPHGAWFG